MKNIPLIVAAGLFMTLAVINLEYCRISMNIPFLIGFGIIMFAAGMKLPP